MTDNADKCKTNLLDDLPVDDDAFGGHQRIASALAELVEKEDGGKAIALKGSWGSGKSSVIRIFQNQLKQQNKKAKSNVEVFIFDSWIHQGDPLKRSFIEELIKFFEIIGWTKKASWDSDLDLLSKRKEETETKSSPVLTFPGTLLAISTILLPIGYLLFGDINSDNPKTLFSITFSETCCSFLNWEIGSFLVVLPFVICFLTWIYYCLTKGCKDSVNIFHYFFNKTVDKTIIKTTRTPDPTSIEFREIFFKVMGDSLKPENKLVIVIDNLDRIPKEEAITIWSTMRIFFEAENNHWIKNFWLIVPFVPEVMEKAWEIEKSGQNEQISEPFIEKTFQTSFNISPPALVKWQKYFNNQMEKAFPDHNKGEFYAVSELFQLSRENNEAPITPRDAILFINKLGSLHRQWCGEIPMKYQALYILKENKIKRIPKETLKKDKNLITQTEKELVGEDDWQIYLASLHFNVEKEDVMDVLIGDDVERALASGNLKEIVSLKQKANACIAVIDHVLVSTLSHWALNSPHSIALSGYAIKEIDTDEDPIPNQIWVHLLNGIKKVNHWIFIDKNTCTGIVEILKQAEESEIKNISASLFEAIKKSKEDYFEDSKSSLKRNANQWLEGMVILLSFIHDSQNEKLLEDSFEIPGDVKFYCDILSSVKDIDIPDRIIKYLKPSYEVNVVIDEFVNRCKIGTFNIDQSYSLEVMDKISDQWSWQILITSLNQRLQATNNLEVAEISGCVGGMIFLSAKAYGQAKQNLEQLAKQSHLFHHLHSAVSKKDHEAIAHCILPVIFTIPDGEPTAMHGQASHGQAYYKNILSKPDDYKKDIKQISILVKKYNLIENLILEYRETSQLKSLVSDIFQEIFKENEIEKFFPSELIIDYYHATVDLLGKDNLEKAILIDIEKGNLLEKLEKFNCFEGQPSLCLESLIKCDLGKSDKYIRYLKNGLSNVLKEKWVEELNNDGDILKMLVSMETQGVGYELRTAYLDALEEYSKKLITGKEPSEYIKLHIEEILKPLGGDNKKSLLRRIMHAILENHKNNKYTVLGLFEKPFVDEGILIDSATRVVDSLYDQIVKRGDVGELEWLKRNIDNMRTVFDKADKAAKNTFKQRIADTLEDKKLSEKSNVVLTEIAKTLGIEIPQDEKTKNDNIKDEEDS